MGLAAAGLFATVTLTVIITAAIGGVLLAVWYGRIAWVLPAVLIGAALALLAFGPSLQSRIDEQFGDAVNRPAWVPDTMDYRYRLWRDQYLPIVRDGKWWTGYGPDSPPNLSFAFTESLVHHPGDARRPAAPASLRGARARAGRRGIPSTGRP